MLLEVILWLTLGHGQQLQHHEHISRHCFTLSRFLVPPSAPGAGVGHQDDELITFMISGCKLTVDAPSN